MICVRRPSWLDFVSLLFAFTAFILHVLGTAFPVWWVVHEPDKKGEELTFYYGIWVIIDCRNGSCITTSSRMNNDRAWLIGPAVLIIMSVVLLLLVLVITCVYMLWDKHEVFYRKLCVVLSGGAGGVITMAVLIFYKKKAGLRPSYAPETSEGDPGWSLFLSAGGAIVAIINAIANVPGARRASKLKDGKTRKKTVFGIEARELEMDVNALRRGELSFGKNINALSVEKYERDQTQYKQF